MMIFFVTDNCDHNCSTHSNYYHTNCDNNYTAPSNYYRTNHDKCANHNRPSPSYYIHNSYNHA